MDRFLRRTLSYVDGSVDRNLSTEEMARVVEIDADRLRKRSDLSTGRVSKRI